MKALSPFLALGCLANLTLADLPAFDPFADATGGGGTAYSVGNAIYGQTNAAGRYWTAAGPAGVNVTIEAGNLSIPGLMPSAGNMIQYGYVTGPSARFNLTPGGAPINSGSLFYSFALRITDLGTLGTSGGFSVAFNNSLGTQSSTPSVIAASMLLRSVSGSPGAFNIGLRKISTDTPSWDPTVYTTGQTLFIVASYTFQGGSTTDDFAQMWINPSAATFSQPSAPTPTLTHTLGNDISGAQIASLIFFRRGNANAAFQPATMFSDEVRVGFTWADVTQVPEPSALALMLVFGLAGALAVRRGRWQA